MDDLRNIALGILLLMVIALAHTICCTIDDETSATEKSKSNISADHVAAE